MTTVVTRVEGKLLAGGEECKCTQLQWKSVWKLLENLKIEPSRLSCSAPECVHSKDLESTHHRDTCSSMFIAILPTIAREWNQAECPSKDWMDKENVEHIHSRILCIHEDKWNNEICRKVDATENHYVKISQSQEWQTLNVLLHMQNLNLKLAIYIWQRELYIVVMKERGFKKLMR